jgi:hypothetical protein
VAACAACLRGHGGSSVAELTVASARNLLARQRDMRTALPSIWRQLPTAARAFSRSDQSPDAWLPSSRDRRGENETGLTCVAAAIHGTDGQPSAYWRYAPDHRDNPRRILAMGLAFTAVGRTVATLKTFLIIGLIAMAVIIIVWFVARRPRRG